jgi:hypothetical protein
MVLLMILVLIYSGSGQFLKKMKFDKGFYDVCSVAINERGQFVVCTSHLSNVKVNCSFLVLDLVLVNEPFSLCTLDFGC